jgi:hypothetical protein
MEGAMGEADRTPRRFAKKARCAIYTRKSSEEGLEQAFNSLDAQREACAAYILSQKHEGWTVLPASQTTSRRAKAGRVARRRDRHTSPSI